MIKGHFMIAGAVSVLALSAFAFVSFFETHDGAIKMRATIEAQERLNEQLQRQIQDLKAAEESRDAAARATIAAMQQLVSKVRTPEQIAQWLPAQFPSPQPVRIDLPPATPQNPTPPAIATILQADLPFLRDSIEGCKECTVKLANVQADLASRDQRLRIAQDELAAIQTERDAAVRAAKGGGLLARMKRNLHWFFVGAVAGGIAVCGSGHCK